MEYQANEILDVAVEVGINLLRCGAEIRRVEDTIKYIGKAYGATSVDVFAIPTLIIATIEVNGQTYTTKVKRNYDVTTDLFRLEKYNKLSRRICQEKPNLEEVKAEVTRIAPSPTGFLHMGTLYGAMIDKFLADNSNGVFCLRIATGNGCAQKKHKQHCIQLFHNHASLCLYV